MTTEKESALRAFIGKLLANGLRTQTEPFPETVRQVPLVLNAAGHLPFDGIQRVRPGLVVTPGPASPPLANTTP